MAAANQRCGRHDQRWVAAANAHRTTESRAPKGACGGKFPVGGTLPWRKTDALDRSCKSLSLPPPSGDEAPPGNQGLAIQSTEAVMRPCRKRRMPGWDYILLPRARCPDSFPCRRLLQCRECLPVYMIAWVAGSNPAGACVVAQRIEQRTDRRHLVAPLRQKIKREKERRP